MRSTKGSVGTSTMKEVSKSRTSERLTAAKPVKGSSRTSSQKATGHGLKATTRKGGTSK